MRWDSTYQIINRLLYLQLASTVPQTSTYQGIKDFLHQEANSNLKKYLLMQQDWKILSGVGVILEVYTSFLKAEVVC